MTKQEQHRIGLFGTEFGALSVALAFAFVLALIVVAPAAQAQSYQYMVIHNFTGQPDGKYPESGVTLDAAGNLYGTTYSGGVQNFGMVFRLQYRNPSWTLSDLYSFRGGSDAENPMTRVVFGPEGALYGATDSTVFSLKPPLTVCKTVQCFWAEKQIATGLETPGSGDLVFDSAKNIYSATIYGGAHGYGEAFELPYSNGSYGYQDIYDFTRGLDGAYPNGVILDQSGNLYGTANEGGMYGYGTVFQLQPASPWFEATFYSFVCRNNPDGCYPVAGLTFDPSGDLFGATSDSDNGSSQDGTAFELYPGGGWNNFSTINNFNCPPCSYEGGPYRSLLIDAKGNLYGTAYYDGNDGYGYGSVFELSPNGDGTYKETDLYDFCSASNGKTPCTDGTYPLSNVVMDAAGNLYGTASEGGSSNDGVVWELKLQNQ